MNNEYVVNIESPTIQVEIRKAQEMFEAFHSKYCASFDLTDEAKIERVYRAAQKEGIFAKGKGMRQLLFGRNISLYGVCYLGTKCNMNCGFCPMGQANWKNHLRGETSSNRLITLSIKEASKDLDALVEIGHQEICILAGEEISCDPGKVIEYAQLAANKPGVKEVILNMGAYTENIFGFIKENIMLPAGVMLQHRVFQETYDRTAYAYYLARAPKVPGSKADFDFRYNSQVAALRAGFDETGIGALFGLSRFPLEEIKGLQTHAAYIKKYGGKYPKRCCLPIANNPEPIENPVDVKYFIPGMKTERMITELIYALAKLAMPAISIVSSERDNPETLELLDKYADHCTLFVHPTPGGNTKALAELRGTATVVEIEKVAQAEVFPRQPADALRSWRERGYNVLGFDVTKYDLCS